MHNLTKFFYLMQLMRAMPQTGWARLYGSSQPSNLGVHSYLVAIVAWRLAVRAREAGGKVNVEKVMALALMHDAGELFGGDISMVYAKANPKAREGAKAFEEENLKFLLSFLDGDAATKDLFHELEHQPSDEARIVKIADYIELQLYLQFVERYTPEHGDVTTEKIRDVTQRIEDAATRSKLEEVVERILKDFKQFTSYNETVASIMQNVAKQ